MAKQWPVDEDSILRFINAMYGGTAYDSLEHVHPADMQRAVCIYYISEEIHDAEKSDDVRRLLKMGQPVSEILLHDADVARDFE